MKKAIRMMATVLMLVSMSCTACGIIGKEDTKTFKIGGVGPLSGEQVFYGQEVQNGMMLAIEEINADGGICGKQVQVNFVDDKADPEVVLEAYEELKEWGVHTIVGAVTSDACTALSEVTCEDNVFQITPSSSAEDSVDEYNVFQVCFSDQNQGAAAAEYIYKNGIGDRLAVVYDMSSSYSVGVFRGFSDKAHEIGLEMKTIEGVKTGETTDFTKIVERIMDAETELVFIPIYYQEAGALIKQARNMGCEAQFFGCDGVEGILELEGFDAELAEGMMYLTPFVSNEMSMDAIAFSRKYEEMYGRKPSQFAADAYDAVYIIRTAAQEAGVTVDMSAEKMCDAMIGAMRVIEFEGITSLSGTVMRWDTKGMVEKEAKVAIIKNGAYHLK